MDKNLGTEVIGNSSFFFSKNTQKLDSAIIEVQKRLKTIAKSDVNPYFNSKYAGLPDIMKSVMPLLNEQEIVLTQGGGYSPEGNCVSVVTRLAHAGQFMCVTTCVGLDKKGPHASGAGISYAKRYGITSILGLVTEEDDDGNAASAGPPAKTAKKASATKTKGNNSDTEVLNQARKCLLDGDFDGAATHGSKLSAKAKEAFRREYEAAKEGV